MSFCPLSLRTGKTQNKKSQKNIVKKEAHGVSDVLDLDHMAPSSDDLAQSRLYDVLHFTGWQVEACKCHEKTYAVRRFAFVHYSLRPARAQFCMHRHAVGSVAVCV